MIVGGHNLSGGQWQRLAQGGPPHDPRRPTASLDPVADNTLGKLMASAGHYAELFEIQAAAYR